MSLNTSGWSSNKSALHKVFLVNELNGGESSAYKISYAGAGKSGFSFGFNQMDLSANSIARETLEDIMDNAKDEQDKLVISSNEKNAIKQVWTAKNNPSALTQSQKNIINKALQSSYGKAKVDSTYSEELDKNLNHIDTIIATVTNADDQSVLQEQVATLFLCDYHNQYNLSTNGKMHSFLKGVEVTLEDKSVKKSDPICWFDLMNFYANTKYNLANKDDGKRRAKQVINCSDLSPEDHVEYSKIVDKAFNGESPSSSESDNKPQPAHAPSSFSGAFAFPLDIGKGKQVDQKTVKQFFNHTEKEKSGGYFPLGANTVWHGGVHIHVKKGSAVYAAADGEVVAAKLAESDSLAKGHFGSHNFILVKHVFSGDLLNRQFSNGQNQSKKFTDTVQKTAYTLYMHLNNEVIDQNSNKSIVNVNWLSKIKLYKVKQEINFRQKTDLTKQTVIGKLSVGTTLVPVDSEIRYASNQEWVHVKANDGSFAGQEGYVAVAKDVAGFIEAQYEADQSIVDALKAGDVVKVEGRNVRAGDQLWTSGEYGTNPVGLLHWEIFSEENLFPSFTEVVDNDEDCNMDSKKIFDMVEQDNSLFDDKNNLSANEIIRFYKTNAKAAVLRNYSCKFVNEWGFNLDVVIPKMKGRFLVYGLKEHMAPYLWWQKAKDKEIKLPASTHIWHYNPVSVISTFTGVQADVQASTSKFRFPLDKEVRKKLPGYHNDANGSHRYFGAVRKSKEHPEIIRYHAGCDLYTKDGTPVYAIADGKILHHRDFGTAAGHTWVLEVAHGDYTVRYGEVKPPPLPEGLIEKDVVKRGQHIADVALFPDGSHMLHFEIYKGKELENLTLLGNATNYLYVPPKKYQRRKELMNPTQFLDECLDE